MAELRIADRYEPLETVGRGGEATVVKAVDTRHDRLVALKLRAASPTASCEHVLGEARVLLSLPPHPGLAHARDDLFDNGHHVLVLDWVDGVNLGRLLADAGQPGLPVSSVLRWIAQASEAITVLHQHGVVHGDVKPANLILDRTGRIVLVDLGSSSVPLLEATRGGTPGFRAPEVAAGAMPDRLSDVFSLAATAFALLTGSAPTGELPTWDGIPAETAGRLETALRAGLAIDPARRPATPGELVERLRAGWNDQTPTGVGTVVLTDVVGSTELWERAPQHVPSVLAEMQLAIDRSVEHHRGRRLGATVEGDTTVSTFPNAMDAVRAAVAIQRTLSTQPAGVKVRAGLATGELVRVDSDVLGPTVSRAARVRDLAGAGEILLSASTADVARLALPAGVELVALGPHLLRGLEGTDEIAAVMTEGVSSPPDPSRSPYPGLASFGRDDADLFFGREEVVERALELFTAERFVAVVGASGSGKSSVVLAGITPRLAEVAIVRPGVHPAQSLQQAGIPGRDSAVLVVDQLEELVTLCHDPVERAFFVDSIVAHPGGLVVAMRADLYGEFGAFTGLADRLASSQVLLGPLADADLLRAVQEPARRCGLQVEDGLAELIAAELGEAPGALPLLGHALREAWLRREGRRITVAGYRASGGVRSAIATTAEQALAALDTDGQAVARRVLLRMVELRPEGDDTRRWASRREITDVDPQRIDDVIATLTESRLLVSDHDHISVAHEALLRAWPRLNGWISDERADLLALQELRLATERWASGDRSDADLYRGLRLDNALGLARRAGLSGQEREFIEAGRLLRERERTEARRRTRRLRTLAAVTSVLAACAVAVGIIALVQRTDAQQARTEADESARQAEQAAAVADEQRLASEDALLSARARDLVDDQLDLALLLAVEARRRSDGPDALDALASVLRAQPAVETFTPLGTASSDGMDVGADGRRGATLDGDQLVRFTLPDLTMEAPLTIGGAIGLAMSPDSSQIAVTTDEGVTIVNAATGAIDATLAMPESASGGAEGVVWVGPSKLGVRYSGRVNVVDIETGFDGETVSTGVAANAAMASDETGRRLAIGPLPPGPQLIAADSKVQIVDTATGELTRRLVVPSVRVTDLSFQPGGDLLAVGTADAGLYVIDTATDERVLSRVTPAGASGRFSPDGTKLAVRDGTGTVTVIEPTTGAVLVPPVTQARELRNLYFSPDADVLVADAVDVLVTIRMDGREPLASAPFGEPSDVAAAVSSDGEVAWALEHADFRLPAHERPADESVAYQPDDGRVIRRVPGWTGPYGPGDDWLLVAQPDGSELVIDARSGATLFTGGVLRRGYVFWTDPGASMIARVRSDGQHIDVRRLPDLSPIETRLDRFNWDVMNFNISTDGRRIAFLTVEVDGTLVSDTVMVHVLDIASGEETIEPIRWPDDGAIPLTVAFTADDRTLLVGDQSGSITEIDMVSGARAPSRFEGMHGPVVGLWSPGDGRLLAASHDGTMWIFDAASGEPLGPPMGWDARVDPSLYFGGIPTTDLAVHHLLAQVTQGLRLWNIDPATWPAVACERAGRNLSPDEWTRYMPAEEEYRLTCPQFLAG